ncbi:ankyrin repeat-containing domain protein [Hypoxylon sp. FL1857]|nr:ankyrin repeat-containing domain protein [Hypoxylon sp. FL1857]
MEVLSVSASIAGLVSLADLVFRTTTRYVKCVKGARSEVRDLLNEVKHFSSLLHNLSLVAYELESAPSSGDLVPPSSSNLKLHHIHDCRQVLNRIERGLASLKDDLESPSALSRLQGRLKWPFSSTETKEMIESIQRQKQTINLAVTADSFNQLKRCLSRQEDSSRRLSAIQVTVGRILDIETKVTLNQARRDVLKLFTKEANPKSDLEMNQKLRHPLTAIWFTESREFKEWHGNPGSNIWISGIPGAGKSVLAGAIITKCLELSSADDKVASAYFFCTYKDSKTHLARNILSSLASQIARQNEEAFQILEEYYEELRSYKHLPGDPSPDRLLDVLARMSSFFDQVFVVVDGLDECDIHIEEVVENLLELSTRRSDGIITTALLSRDELQIRLQLEADFKHVDVAAHTEDIQLYVASELEKRTSSKKLKLRDLSLKDQIMIQLVNGAKGMFRWVACQLDHLCNLPTDKARREALTKLPPTLPASYERIIHRVEKSNEQVQKLVQHSLQLIACRRRLSIEEICEAVSVPTNQDTFESDEVVDGDEIMKWCSSLIRKSTDGRNFEFAHHSVMEFLEEIHSTHPSLHAYRVSRDNESLLLGPLCLRYLTFKNYEEEPMATEDEIQLMSERNEARPFYEHATMWWPEYVKDQLENPTIHELLCTLFDSKKTASFTSWALELARHCVACSDEVDKIYFSYCKRTDFGQDDKTALDIISSLTRPDFTPLHMAAALGLPNICQYLLERGARADLRSRFGTPLHCALGGLTVFADEELHPEEIPEFRPEFPPSGRYRTVQVLLAAGASTSLHLVTPFRQTTILTLAIQSSQCGEDLEMIADLIRAGVQLEDEDLAHFTVSYDYAMEDQTPDEYKRKYATSKAIGSLLEALGTPDDDSSPGSRLYTETLKFARAMKLQLDNSLFESTLPRESASEDAVREFLMSVIENNDMVSMERFIENDQLQRIKTLKFFDDDNWSALHLAVNYGSPDILKLLLEAGCEPNVTATDMSTPLHLCYDNEDQDILRVLVQHGASTIAQDKVLDTIWHLCAYWDSTQVLRVLLELDPDADAALKIESDQGITPICQALSRGSKNSVHLLLPYCSSVKHWKGNMNFFREAAQLGSLDIVQKLIDVGIPLDNLDPDMGSPLHFLSIDASAECTSLLVKHFPHCQVRDRNGRTPFESLLVRAARDPDGVSLGACKELLSGFQALEREEKSKLWLFVCPFLVSCSLSSDSKPHWLSQLLSYLFEIGVVTSYEEDKKTSALVPISAEVDSYTVTFLPRATALRRGAFDEAVNKSIFFNKWPWFSEILVEIMTASSYWTVMPTPPSITQLLSSVIIHDDTKMINLLLEKGVDVNHRADTLSPLELACLHEVAISEENFARLLSFTEASQLNRLNDKIEGRGPVHLTAIVYGKSYNLWKLKQILQAGADCNIRSTVWNEPALGFHIGEDSIPTAKTLLEAGADPWATDTRGWNAALNAILINNTSILDDVQRISTERKLTPKWEQTWKAHVDNRFFSGGNALHLAAAYGSVECLEFYLDKGLLVDLGAVDDDLHTPMHYAARFDKWETVLFLKERGCSVNAVTRDGISPLHYAVQMGNYETVEVLLDLGAALNACSLGMTPLAYAYRQGSINIIKLLKSYEGKKASKDVSVNQKGIRILFDPFSSAVRRSDISACEDLCNQGCPVDFELEEPWPVTPLMMAVYYKVHPDMIKWLVNHGATVSAQFQGLGMPPLYTVLEAAMASPLYAELIPMLLAKYLEQGGGFSHLPRSPLHIAVNRRNYEGLQAFVDTVREHYNHRGISPSSCGHDAIALDEEFLSKLVNMRNKDFQGKTALHEAITLGSEDEVEYLLDNMADVNLPDDDGHTPLHQAAFYGSTSIIELLLEHGARLEPQANAGHTPLMAACEASRIETVKLIIAQGEPQVHTDFYGRNLLALLLFDRSRHPHSLAKWRLLIDRGVDPLQSDVNGLNTIHRVLAHPHQDYLKEILRSNSPLSWITSTEWSLARLWSLRGASGWRDASGNLTNTTINTITDKYRFVHRYVGSKQPLKISSSVTAGEGSLFHLAASWGLVKALENILTIGADLEQECGKHGTALMISATNGRLDAVKYLVRKGAKLSYERNGIARSAITAALEHEEVLHWLLVARHTDQLKVTYCETDSHESAPTHHWSGIHAVPIPLKWEWKQSRGETMIDYARRRQDITAGLRGLVIQPIP